MLSQLRKKKTMKRIFWFLVATIIPGFAFWGVGSIMNPNKADFAGKAYGRKVSDREYLSSYNSIRILSIMKFGDSFNEVAKLLNLRKQAWERFLLLKEANKRHFKVSDEEVVAQIQGDSLFQTEKTFNSKLYDWILKQSLHLSPREYEEQVRESLKIKKLYDSIVENIQIDDAALKEEYKKANAEFKINYIKISIKDFAAKDEKSESDPKGGKEALEKAKELAQQKAQSLLEQLKKSSAAAGFNFAKAASGLGYEAKISDYFKANSFNKEIGITNRFSQACQQLKIGELSGLIDQPNAFFIFSLVEKKEPPEEDFNKNKAVFKEAQISVKKYTAYQDFLNSLAKSANLQENPVFFERYKLQ